VRNIAILGKVKNSGRNPSLRVYRCCFLSISAAILTVTFITTLPLHRRNRYCQLMASYRIDRDIWPKGIERNIISGRGTRQNDFTESGNVCVRFVSVCALREPWEIRAYRVSAENPANSMFCTFTSRFERLKKLCCDLCRKFAKQ
jgi:hypothetical protein